MRPSTRPIPWIALFGSVAVIFLLLHGSAAGLGSLRGEAGLAVALLVVPACLAAQRVFGSASLAAAARDIGLGGPTGRSLAVALGISLLLLAAIPIFAWLTGARATSYPGWPLLLPGLFAQGGIAEETLFRGLLFGNLRRQHPFWKAAWLSAGPFVAVHLLLFTTMSWPVALAATLLAWITSFPLAHLYELGNRTIWAPALVHFTIQGAVKVVELPGAEVPFPMVWLAVCAVVPWGVFVVRGEESGPLSRGSRLLRA
jgi:membrane protease YdiL (CAAX protease family)